jgi:hypothetical protein
MIQLIQLNLSLKIYALKSDEEGEEMKKGVNSI